MQIGPIKKEEHLEFLKRSAHVDRLSHAYIFSGNDEERKNETIIHFVQYLNCEKAKKPCLSCRSCSAVQGKAHADVLHVEPVSSGQGRNKEITIAQIRKLQEFINLGSWIAEYKVAVILQADAMNLNAQAALLKLLEEPKGKTLLFLLAKHPEMVLNTIRSRAQTVAFWSFAEPSKKQRGEEVRSLSMLPINERFELAKQLAETPEEAIEKLEQLLSDARAYLLSGIQQESSSENIRERRDRVLSILETLRTITQTNVNLKLALERVYVHV